MRYSHKLSDAVHILAYIEVYHDGDLSSQAIAASVESNPALIRRLMVALRQAGLLTTQQGAAQPRLTREPGLISLLDIYRAVRVEGSLLHIDDKTNPQCIVGGNIQETLRGAYQQVQRAAENQMAQIKLSELIAEIWTRERQRESL